MNDRQYATVMIGLIVVAALVVAWVSGNNTAELWNKCNPQVKITWIEALTTDIKVTHCNKEQSNERRK